MKLTPHAFTDIAIKDNVSFKLQIIELEFSIKFQIYGFPWWRYFLQTPFLRMQNFCEEQCVLFEGVLFLLL